LKKPNAIGRLNHKILIYYFGNLEAKFKLKENDKWKFIFNRSLLLDQRIGTVLTGTVLKWKIKLGDNSLNPRIKGGKRR